MRSKINKQTKEFYIALLNAYKENILNNKDINLKFSFVASDKLYEAQFVYSNAFDIYREFSPLNRKLYHTIYIYDNLLFKNLNKGVLSINGKSTYIFTFGSPIKYYNIIEEPSRSRFINKYIHINDKEDVTINIVKLRNKLCRKYNKNVKQFMLKYRAIPILFIDDYRHSYISRYMLIVRNLIGNIKLSI